MNNNNNKRLKQELIDIVYDVKNKLKDSEYKKLTETIAEIEDTDDSDSNSDSDSDSDFDFDSTFKKYNEIIVENVKKKWSLVKNKECDISLKMYTFLTEHTEYTDFNGYNRHKKLTPSKVNSYICNYIDELDLCEDDSEINLKKKGGYLLRDLFNIKTEVGEYLCVDNIHDYILDHTDF